MRTRILIICGLIVLSLILLGGYFLFIYFPNSVATVSTTITPTEMPQQESYIDRKMNTITLRSSTSTKQTCIAEADETYFDEWQAKCETYYAENKTINYASCLAKATTSIVQSNYYNKMKLIEQPRPEDCGLLLKENIFPSNCSLPDGRGKGSTLKWEAAIKQCNEE